MTLAGTEQRSAMFAVQQPVHPRYLECRNGIGCCPAIPPPPDCAQSVKSYRANTKPFE